MDRKWAQPPAPRHQVVLFTETLDDAIPQNYPIRLLDRCLDTVDWTLWENRYDGRRGQPPIHPRLVAGCISVRFDAGSSHDPDARGRHDEPAGFHVVSREAND